jgi:Ca2+-binding EF-hand superfamily protein
MGIRTCLAMVAGAVMLAAPATAQPDFAKTFERLDANKDGVLAFGELRYEGVEAARYARPVAGFVTDDGFGVELWQSPFGIREVSMPDESLETRQHDRARTYLRDERVHLAPWLMLAGNPQLRTMTPARFEEELRRNAALRIDLLDTDKDGGVSAGEIENLLFVRAEHRRNNPEFQRGPGGDAMRARQNELTLGYYANLDLNDDGVFTEDEMLEVILEQMIAAFALPQ